MSTVTTCARCATLVLALATVTLGDAAAIPLHGQYSTTTVNDSFTFNKGGIFNWSNNVFTQNGLAPTRPDTNSPLN